MSKVRVEQLINQTFRNSPELFDISAKVIYSMGELRYDENKVIPDAFLTPMLYTYNSLNDTENNPRSIVIGDMPKLVQLEKWARALNIGQCKGMLNECVEQWKQKGNFKFDPKFRYKSVFIQPRIDYMTEVLR